MEEPGADHDHDRPCVDIIIANAGKRAIVVGTSRFQNFGSTLSDPFSVSHALKKSSDLS